MRTRTPGLLITSDNSGVAGVCTSLQIAHRYANFSSLVCTALHRIASPVVSEWCQRFVQIKESPRAEIS